MTALQQISMVELGAAAAFLASDDSSFMTASEVAVDGGLSQLRHRYGPVLGPHNEGKRS